MSAASAPRFSVVEVAVDPPLGRIVLNRPDRANALSVTLLDELEEAMAFCVATAEVRVVVLSGAGKGFSGGYDIGGPSADPGATGPSAATADIERVRATVERLLRLWDLPKPVLAKVHGYCMAGGFELAMACDLVVAADSARFQFPAVRAQGVAPFLIYPWLMGLRRAAEFLWTGDPISGADAVDLGLVNRAVPSDRLDREADELATRVALMPSELLLLSKRALHRSLEVMGFRTAVAAGVEFDVIAHLSRPAQEFRRIAGDDGLKAALRWRDERYDRPGTETPP